MEYAAALRANLVHGGRPVAWFAGKESLRSGWAWGQHYLEDGVAAAEAKVGKGKVFLLGPEITFRAQPHEDLPVVRLVLPVGQQRDLPPRVGENLLALRVEETGEVARHHRRVHLPVVPAQPVDIDALFPIDIH